MTKPANKLALFTHLLTGQNIVFVGLLWSAFTIFFFLSFSVTLPGEDSPLWYSLGTYLLETLPYGLAAWLCYRNWKSPQIASGREVWLFIGLGLACYFVANFLFGIWELYFGLDPAISPADLFYIGFTICLGWGMVLAVLPRRLNLELKQWGIIAIIAIVGTAFALWLNAATAANDTGVEEIETGTGTEQVEVVEEKDAYEGLPGIIVATDRFLGVFAKPVNLFYAVADVALMIVASTLLLAFWGGRFSQSWRMIAAGVLAKYIADMWLKYVTTLPGQYESGGLMEVFYVFAGVLFALGTALEYDVSTSRRRRRRGVM
ncbi:MULTISPECIES: hypothetical protein [Spirulina sp. CCY15215]|uniref:hypothetical protein n=1 Tax=Spirulina sp. CCY15215 TaxID=2767591 RepID=UPI00194E3376|nr:hypothetical protein [Spirulina major]